MSLLKRLRRQQRPPPQEATSLAAAPADHASPTPSELKVIQLDARARKAQARLRRLQLQTDIMRRKFPGEGE